VSFPRSFTATRFAGGPFVEKFEEEFASYCGCQRAICVGAAPNRLLTLERCWRVSMWMNAYTVDPAGLEAAITLPSLLPKIDVKKYDLLPG